VGRVLAAVLGAAVVTIVAALVYLRGIRSGLDDWFPMRVGDRWTYRDAALPDRVVFDVVGEKDGAFVVERRNGRDLVTFTLSLSGRSVFVHETSQGNFDPPFEEFRLPPVARESWIYRGRFGDRETTVGSEVVSVSKTRCTIFEVAGHGGRTTYTLEKGKGVTRLTGKYEDPHGFGRREGFDWTLESFERGY